MLRSFAWVFLGLGSTAFAVLWFRSGYIPRGLAGWGVLASLLLAAGPVLAFLFPPFGVAVGPAYMIPMFFYEVPLGAWLLLRGLAGDERAATSRP